jgi:hypothetical protein
MRKQGNDTQLIRMSSALANTISQKEINSDDLSGVV